MQPDLQPRHTIGASVAPLAETGWRLEIPPGPAGQYRLAQLDDYSSLPRRSLPWQAPLVARLRARVSAPDISGTWGFGFWNDPFSLSLGLGGMVRRFPALPRAAWFFYAAPPNYLSFRDDLPAQGLLAATFNSPEIPPPLLALGSLGLPLGFIPPAGRLLRRVVRGFVRQGAVQLGLNPVEWHSYSLVWSGEEVSFEVDGMRAASAVVSPAGRLGLVLWIDNQFAAWGPDGRLRFGFLSTPQPAWLEIADYSIRIDNPASPG